MVPAKARAFRLDHYVTGVPAPDTFSLIELALKEPAEGEVLVRVDHLGMDPFPRLRISGDQKRAPQLAIGDVMVGRGVGTVMRSRSTKFAEGDVVAGEIGWRDWAVLADAGLTRVEPALGPSRLALSVLGPAGLAAWSALLARGEAKAGETLLISAAAGAVGSLMAQIGKITGCRVIGVGGGSVQIPFLRDTLKLDAALDFTADEPLAQQIKSAAPAGVDLFVDLVGGTIFDAGINHLAVGGRAILVGTIADYGAPAGDANLGPRPNLAVILKRATVKGFLVADHAANYPQAMADLSRWLAAGQLIQSERIVEGFEQTPFAFAGLFGTDFIGKQLVALTTEVAS